MRTYFQIELFIVLLLAFIVFLDSNIYPEYIFHSDFEPIKTINLGFLKEQSKKIQLAPMDYRLPDSGIGIIEPDNLSKKEVFRFIPKGKYIVLEKPLLHAHDPFMPVILGGFQEWDQRISDLIRIDTAALYNNLSVKIPVSADLGAMIIKKIKVENEFWFHMMIKFSKDMQPYMTEDSLRVTFVTFLPLAISLQIAPDKIKNCQYFYAVYTNNQHKNQYLKTSNEVIFNHPYYMSFHYHPFAQDSALIDLLIDGEIILEKQKIFTSKQNVEKVLLGNLRPESRIFGNIVFDNIIICRQYIPVPCAMPKSFKSDNGNLIWDSPEYEEKEIVCSQWQISHTSSFAVPLFNSGTDTLNKFAINIPDYLFYSKSLFYRMRYCHYKYGWSAWSYVQKDSVDNKKSPVNGPNYISLSWMPGDKNTNKPYVRKELWHNIVIDFLPGKIPKDLSFIDFWCSPSYEQKEAFINRKSSKFDASRFYWASMSVGNQSLWTKPRPGIGLSEVRTGEKSLYIDDSTQSYHTFNGQGRYILRFRLLEQAQTGPWCASIQAKLRDGTTLPQQNFLFFAVKKDFQAEPVKNFSVFLLIVTLSAIVVIIIFIYIRRRKNPLTITLAISDPIFKTANEIIDKNIHQQIKVEDLAKELKITVKRCYELFNRNAGTSVIQYILDKRMKKARELFETTNLNISEVQFKVGFNELSYFSRCFKKWFGENPRTFQKRTREKKN
ncbi:MAG: AraC family transcriptional regulator [bacterium]